MENVTVAMNLQPSDDEDEEGPTLKPLLSISVPKLEFEVPQSVYIVWDKLADVAKGTFSNTLKFIFKEVDVTTGEMDEEGYEDEYEVIEERCNNCMIFFVLKNQL